MAVSSRQCVALGFGARRLRAVLATAETRALRVERVVDVEVPSAVDGEDPQALGGWIGRTLRDAGFPRGRATVALSREQLGFKRMSLPSTDDVELPEMTRLAMEREFPFDTESAVVDYIPVERTETGTTIIAFGAPRSLLDFTEAVMKAAGLSIDRIAPRTMGSAMLLRSLPAEGDGGDLAIDVTTEGVDFTVVTDGAARFCRAAEFTTGHAHASIARAVITETRRTWMSYRIVQGTEDVRAATLIGPESVVGEALEPIAEMLGVPVTRLEYHPLVHNGDVRLEGARPLAGLLLEPVLGHPSIDFAHPRVAPDVHARARQIAIGLVGIAVIAVLAVFLSGRSELKSLEKQKATLSAQATSAQPQRIRYKRDALKIEHLRQWQSTEVDWLEHLSTLVDLAPPTEQLVLDEWAGAIEFRGVRYERGRGWTADRNIRITLEGEARDRATADGFRAALVDSDLYMTGSAGADTAGGRRLSHSFTYALSTDEADPIDDDAPPGAAEESAGNGDDGGDSP